MFELGWIFWAKLGCALLTGIGATGNVILTSMDITQKTEKFSKKLEEKQNTEPEKK